MLTLSFILIPRPQINKSRLEKAAVPSVLPCVNIIFYSIMYCIYVYLNLSINVFCCLPFMIFFFSVSSAFIQPFGQCESTYLSRFCIPANSPEFGHLIVLIKAFRLIPLLKD